MAKAQKEAEAVKLTAKEKAKPKSSTRRSSGRRRKTASESVLHEAKLVGRQILRSEGRKLVRGLLGSMMRR